eukprot:m.185368 g.185368  ORF g.185368 m.185368 type:complete len:174 (+) comp24724_c0_seq2:195-716(+)
MYPCMMEQTRTTPMSSQRWAVWALVAVLAAEVSAQTAGPTPVPAAAEADGLYSPWWVILLVILGLGGIFGMMIYCSSRPEKPFNASAIKPTGIESNLSTGPALAAVVTRARASDASIASSTTSQYGFAESDATDEGAVRGAGAVRSAVRAMENSHTKPADLDTDGFGFPKVKP